MGLVLLAACGGGDAEGERSAAERGPELTGDPVKVMTIAPVNTQLPPYPNIPEAAKIYEQFINDNGGVNGRPLEVITCDGRGDPNEDANCGRRAVEEGVAAVVGSFTFDASRLIPILEQNDIAWFGACCPLVEQEFTSAISFPIGSNFVIPAGAALKMVEDDCKKPAVVFIDIPGADIGTRQVNNAFRSVGFDPDRVKFVRIPIEAQDYSAQVAQATRDTDCIYGGISDSNWAAFLPAMQSAGGDQRLYGHQGNLNSKIAEQFPELTQDAVVINSYPNMEGEMWEDYRASLETYDAPDLDWNSLAGLGTWTAYEAFTKIASGIDGEITNETFLETANQTTALDTGGMVPVLDLTTPYEGFGGDFPRIFNRSVTYDVIDGGKIEAETFEFSDMSSALDARPE